MRSKAISSKALYTRLCVWLGFYSKTSWGAIKGFQYREVAFYELYFRINNLAALWKEKTLGGGGGQRGSRKRRESY